MIHYINIILIIIIIILLNYTNKEGFQPINKIPMPKYTPIPHVPTDIVNYFFKKMGAPKNPNNPEYLLEEQCAVENI